MTVPSPAPSTPAESSEVGRRQFLSTATYAIGGLISALFAVPALAYLLGPALRRQSEEAWIPLGSASKVELGTPTLFRASVEQQTGWIVNQQEVGVYVLTENGRDYISMSNICTHLGCRIRWIDDQGQFFCPCHNGVFSKEGAVVSGPPPRPLDRYPTKVEDGQIYILAG
jgi:menaquinol-cytochrome c reductase iron-sulfur subunit